MAPEYSMHGHLSKAVDVFSFGVLVLELISGHRNYSFNLDVDAENLLDWVRSQSPTVLFISDYCSTGKKKSIASRGITILLIANMYPLNWWKEVLDEPSAPHNMKKKV